MKNSKTTQSVFFNYLDVDFITFYFFLILLMASCGQASSDNDQETTDSAGKNSSTTTPATAFAAIQNQIDILYIDEGDLRAYYDAATETKFRKNKAVLQFVWPIAASSQFFTLGIYPSKNNKYPANNVPPVLYLKNANTGINVSISDIVVLGDQQIKKTVLETIITRLLKNTNNQRVVFRPTYNNTTKHLYYKIYVILAPPASPAFTKDFTFLDDDHVGDSDPSPPADADE